MNWKMMLVQHCRQYSHDVRGHGKVKSLSWIAVLYYHGAP